MDETEEMLRESEERYRTLFERIPVGHYRTTPDGQFLDANPALAEMLGYPDRETLLRVGAAHLHLDPADRARWQALVEREGVVRDFEAQARRRDGTTIWVKDTARAVRGADGQVLYYEGVLEDITERVEAEEELKRLKKFHENIVQRMTEGIVVEDAEGCFTFVNPAAAAMLGRAPEELVGEHWTSIVPSDQQPIVEAAGERRARGEADRYELELTRQDGTRRSVLVSGSPRFEGDRYTGTIGVFTDITARKRVEEERERLLVAEHEQRELAEALRDTASTLTSTLDLDQVLDLILDNVGRVVPHDASNVLLVESNTAYLLDSRGYGEDGSVVPDLQLPLFDTPNLRQMMETGDPLAISNTKAYPGWIEVPEARWVGSYTGAPIRASGEIIGFLSLLSASPGFFTPAHARRLQAFADQAGTAFENARLYQQVQEELAERRRAEEALRKANRALETLGLCNKALVRATDEAAFLREVCQIIVEAGGYRLAWVGSAEQNEQKTVRPVAQAGFENGYLETIHITWADTEYGRGPTGTAIRTGTPAIAENIPTDSDFAPWREEATRRGYASSIALPLVAENRTFGALNVYAAEPNAFDTEEVDLLMDLADDLAYGITVLRTRAEYRRAEAERIRLFAAERSRRQELDSLYALSRQLVATDEIEAVLDSVVRHTTESVHVTFCRLVLLEDEAFVCRAAHPLRVLEFDLRVGRVEPEVAWPHYQRALEGTKPWCWSGTTRR